MSKKVAVIGSLAAMCGASRIFARTPERITDEDKKEYALIKSKQSKLSRKEREKIKRKFEITFGVVSDVE